MEIATIIDIVVLLFLGLTIFYAWRLSSYMKIFRDSRRDMEGLLVKLDQDIVRAEKSVLGMRNAAESAAMKLNETIRESKFLADELKFMNEAGDNLATRLEKLAERNRELMDGLEALGGVTPNTPYRDLLSDQEAPQQPQAARRFVAEQQAPANESASRLSSQAERDLYEALQRKGTGQ